MHGKRASHLELRLLSSTLASALADAVTIILNPEPQVCVGGIAPRLSRNPSAEASALGLGGGGAFRKKASEGSRGIIQPVYLLKPDNAKLPWTPLPVHRDEL